MIIWFLLHISIILLLLLYYFSKSPKLKILYSCLVIVVLVYFSGYRDGIGTDYFQYLLSIEYKTELAGWEIGKNEPLYILLCLVANRTFFSPIFVFLICAIVTNIGIGSFLFKYKKYAVWSILLYVIIPSLYPQSFNLMRQFFAIGVFFFSIRYIGVSFVKYLLCCIVASMMHMSAIILIPFYWLLQIEIKRKHIIVVTLIFSVVLVIGMRYLISVVSRYSIYSSYREGMVLPTIVILYNILFILFISVDRVYFRFPLYLRNLYIYYIIIVDFSFINFSFYRFSYYFYPIVALSIPYTLHKISKGYVLNFVLVVLLLISFYTTKMSNVQNSERILPISSIIDTYYTHR